MFYKNSNHLNTNTKSNQFYRIFRPEMVVYVGKSRRSSAVGASYEVNVGVRQSAKEDNQTGNMEQYIVYRNTKRVCLREGDMTAEKLSRKEEQTR